MKMSRKLTFYPKPLLTSPPSTALAALQRTQQGPLAHPTSTSALILKPDVPISQRADILADVFQRHQSRVTSHGLVMPYGHLSEDVIVQIEQSG